MYYDGMGVNELASQGYTWQQILRYFYGSDIVIEKAEIQ
jgi:peptidoglycan hydrolase-like amidase